MLAYEKLQTELKASPSNWLVTGIAGFIGSNLLESLLKLNQRVIGLDNFSTGFKKNLDAVQAVVKPEQWALFQFVEGDILDRESCNRCCEGVEIVLHQAGINSAPRSLDDPAHCHGTNVTGFVNMYLAARERNVKRFVYASSSTVYGDDPHLPKVEDKIGKPISPYGATKQMAEMYAEVFARCYGFPSVGLRYFNVFGARQNMGGAYAAVIPKWIAAILRNESPCIFGDGETSRDFSYVENVVQANLLAGTTENAEALNQVYNVGTGRRIRLNELFELLQKSLRRHNPSLPDKKPVYGDFRAGDVQHSLADISKARRLLGFEPTHYVEQGLEMTMEWYCRNLV